MPTPSHVPTSPPPLAPDRKPVPSASTCGRTPAGQAGRHIRRPARPVMPEAVTATPGTGWPNSKRRHGAGKPVGAIRHPDWQRDLEIYQGIAHEAISERGAKAHRWLPLAMILKLWAMLTTSKRGSLAWALARAGSQRAPLHQV